MNTALLVLVGFFLLAGFSVYLVIVSAKKAESELNSKLNSITHGRKQSSSSNTIGDGPLKSPPSTRSSTTQETTSPSSGN